MLFNRRNFIKSLVTGVGLLRLGIQNAKLWAKNNQNRDDPFYAGFCNPPAKTRPFFRWWWNGNRVNEEEIYRELALIQQAGAGGVEINPIAMHETVKNPPGREIDWLSDKWKVLINNAIQRGKKLDLFVDLIVGTGWPFGGKFLKQEETIQGLELTVKSITGPSIYRDVIGSVSEPNRKLMQLVLYPKRISNLLDGIDLLDQIQVDGTIEFDVLAGEYDLYTLTRNLF